MFCWKIHLLMFISSAGPSQGDRRIIGMNGNVVGGIDRRHTMGAASLDRHLVIIFLIFYIFFKQKLKEKFLFLHF